MINLLTLIEEQIQHELEQMQGSKLYEPIAYALSSGGKRMRPLLVLCIAEPLGFLEGALKAALAVELFHTASLVADDLPCMDNAARRRFKPTLHRAYDEATALLVSYSLISHGYAALAQGGEKLLQTFDDGAIRMTRAFQVVSLQTGVHGACGGQFLDMTNQEFDERSLRRLIEMKTASLFDIAFSLGWLYGGGECVKLAKVQKAAGHFGMAYQIADDFADLEEDLKMNRASSFPLCVGQERAKELFTQETKAFSLAFSELGLPSEQLVAALQGRLPAHATA